MKRSLNRKVRWALRVATLCFAFGLHARVARADEESELAKARNAYLARHYDEADSRFRALFDPKSGVLHDSDLIADARMYWGAVLIALQKEDDAANVFEKLLSDKPDYEPDPLRVPADVVNRFIDVRAKVREVLASERADRLRIEAEKRRKMAERVAMLERLAGQKIVKTPHSRWVALLPFGVGQFQNGQTATGATLLTLEALLVAASVTTVPLYNHYIGESNAAAAQSDPAYSGQRFAWAKNARDANLVFDGVLVAAALAGIAHAEATFVPEDVRVEHREIPSAMIVPAISRETNGSTAFGFLLGGRF